MDVSLGELWEMVMDREAWCAVIHGVAKSRTRLSNWTELNWTEAGRILSYTGGSAILCYSDLQLIGWGPLRLRKAICLVSLWTKVLISFQTSSQKHLEQCLAIYLSVLWPIKLAHQISHPSFQPHVFIIWFNPSIPFFFSFLFFSLPITSLWVIPMHQPQACCILRQT